MCLFTNSARARRRFGAKKCSRSAVSSSVSICIIRSLHAAGSVPELCLRWKPPAVRGGPPYIRHSMSPPPYSLFRVKSTEIFRSCSCWHYCYCCYYCYFVIIVIRCFYLLSLLLFVVIVVWFVIHIAAMIAAAIMQGWTVDAKSIPTGS